MKWLRRYLDEKEPTLKKFAKGRAAFEAAAARLASKHGASPDAGGYRRATRTTDTQRDHG